jgi:hypothetical protein
VKSLVAVVAILILSMTLPAQAGTWKKLSPKTYEDCGYLYSGVIKKGDLVNFHKSGKLKGVKKICLDSAGGSLSEAFDFIKLTRFESSFATRVLSGDVCLSSCALVFMFGQAWGVNSPYPSRELQPGARLGFHSPFPAGGGTQTAVVSDVFNVALDVSKLLLDNSYTAMSSKGAPIPPEVLAIMLDTPGDDMRDIETVGELQLLDIGMTNRPEENLFIKNDVLTFKSAVQRVCVSSYVSTYRQHHVTDGYKYKEILAAVAKKLSNHRKKKLLHLKIVNKQFTKSIVGVDTGSYYIPGWYSAGAALFCRVEFSVEERKSPKGFVIKSYSVGFGAMNPDVEKRLPKQEDTQYRGMSIGLIPMSKPY